MASMVLSGVVQKLAVIAGNLIVEEGSRLSRLKEDILWIENEMRYIRSYLEDVDAIQRKSRGVTDLIRNVWDLAYDVDDIIDTYFPKLASSGWNDSRGRLAWFKRAKWILLNCKTARDFAVEIEGIKRRVEGIKNARQTYGIQERSGRGEEHPWDPRRSFPHMDEVYVVGIDKHLEELAAKVLDDDLRHGVVCITGMAGLGKTTLARKVYNSVRREFQCSAWIYVSQQPNREKLLLDIAGQVGLEEEKCKRNLEVNLFEFLSQTRYVIVIDDIWDINPWNALKMGIPINSEKGSRIIITSRYKIVGDNIGVQVVQVGGQSFPLELQPLNEENSRKLFFTMIMTAPQSDGESSASSQLKNIGDHILERCSGVPLAIVVTAGLLLSREKSQHAWKGVLESMGHEEDQYSGIFALSYTDLPIKLKPCFLYFGLFPEDHEISAFELINIWAAEGFIQGSEGRKVEDVGDDYLNHLIGRNLIQVVRRSLNGRVESCHIHDILHSLCIRVANEINFLNTRHDVSTQNSAVNTRRIAIYGSSFDDYVSLNYRTPKLRAMMFSNGKISLKRLGDFLGEDRFLRVLSLRSSDIDSTSFILVLIRLTMYICPTLLSVILMTLSRGMPLPNEVGNLSHLSYLQLGFRWTTLRLPHTISNLKSLVTLDVRECWAVILPNVIWKMEQLRHILLPEICWSRPRSFCGVNNLDRWFRPIEVFLPNLQTLYGLPGPDVFEAVWLHKFTSLRTLKVNRMTDRIIEVLSDAASPVSDTLEELWLPPNFTQGLGSGKLRALNLSHYKNLCNLRLEDNIKKLPQQDKLPPNLTNLTLWNTSLQEDQMETLKKLRELKNLKLLPGSYVGTKMVCSGEPADSFPQLEVLEIRSLIYLRELIVEEGAMPKLKHFTIFDCNPVMTIPDRIRNIMK